MTEEKKKAVNKRLVSPAFYVALLGAAKLVTDAFGFTFITDEQVNAIANGLATIATVVGVAIGYDV